MDFLQNDGGFANTQARSAISLGNQRSHVSGAGKGLNKGFGVGAFSVEIAPIRVRKVAAQVGHGGLQLLMEVICGSWGHGTLVAIERSRRSTQMNVDKNQFSCE